jgi:aminoglycoside 6'-N-acetyltransferase
MTAPIISFRPLTRGDFDLLARWLAAPHVEAWWREDPEPGAIEERYGPGVDGLDPTELFVIELGDRAVGLIQRYRFDDNPEWRAALAPAGTPGAAFGIDYLIGEERDIGSGLGQRVIGDFIARSWDRYPDVVAVVAAVVGVDADNRRSWRALEKAGFQRAWTGRVESEDPSDQGVSHVYVLPRPGRG